MLGRRSAAADDRSLDLVIITGLSGAGRSEAIHTFEDAGYFCIDNLPPSFIGHLVDLTHLSERMRRVAVVCDIRGMDFFGQLEGELERLDHDGAPHTVLFLEADEDVLVQRFKETRRRHPLSDAGSVLEGIRQERRALAPIRAASDLVIDTSTLRPRELRERIIADLLGSHIGPTLVVDIVSFGFKYGVPIDADIVMDVRFLPNPYYDAIMRPMTGLDDPVREYVSSQKDTKRFLKRWYSLLDTVMPGYVEEGKSQLTVAIGCTGGRHRSVVVAEETAAHLRCDCCEIRVNHRDIERADQEPAQ